jgi:aspartate/methionine/tyrosine aminotransferase
MHWKNLSFDLNDTILCYGNHLGKNELRELIAKNNSVSPNDILITAGAAAGLFIVASSLLDNKSHMIVQKPNYATNIETPNAIGCSVDFIKIDFEDKFQIDIDRIEKLIKPNTKYISITYPHNPTGVCITKKELEQIIAVAEKHNCLLLLDETYRELSFEEKIPLAASLSENAISISSMSKAYGLPGIRIGWLITKNKSLLELFLAAKEQIFVCNSVIDEEIAFQFLKQKEKYFSQIKSHIQINFSTLEKWLSDHKYLEWIKPRGGVIGFPRFKKEARIDIENFHSILNNKYKTFVGPGHWFDMPKKYFRIGYGWPTKNEIEQGLKNIDLSIEESRM